MIDYTILFILLLLTGIIVSGARSSKAKTDLQSNKIKIHNNRRMKLLPLSQEKKDAIAGLIYLGINKTIATMKVSEFPEGLSVETMIKNVINKN